MKTCLCDLAGVGVGELKVRVIEEKEHFPGSQGPLFLMVGSLLMMSLWANHSISLASLVTSVGAVLVENLTS